MKIGWNLIDIDPKVPSGSLHHAQQWIRALARYDRQHQHTAFITPAFGQALGAINDTPHFTWRRISSPSASRLRWQREVYFARHGNEIRREVDILVSLHAPPLAYRGPTVSIVLDCVLERCPGEYPLSTVAYGKLSHVLSRRSLGWLTSCDFNRNEIAGVRRLPLSRIRAVPIPLDENATADPSRIPPPGWRDLRTPFAFCCCTISPRKNLARLVEAFQISFPGREMILVIAGRPGWKCAEEMRRIRAAEDAGRVRYLGTVDNATRDWCYRHALFVVYPSLYEGFGLPVVEGFQFGKPVLTSAGTAMAEIGGEAVLLCDPRNPDDLAAQCHRLYRDSALREALIVRGQKRRLEFRPEPIARRLSQAITELAGGG